jgi:long-chain acyl-CoA synthetase
MAEQLSSCEVRALFALGLRRCARGSGRRGDKRRRRRLQPAASLLDVYWAIAAQSLGAVPVPVYADAVAEELAYVLDNAGVRFAVVQDQEQVDKIQSFAARSSTLTHIIYDEPRGLRDYDPQWPARLPTCRNAARRCCRRSGAWRRWEEAIRAASGDDISVMLYTSGTTGRSKGVMIKAAHAVNAARTRRLRQSQRERQRAGLPAARLGRRPLLNYAQGYVSGFCMNCPESPDRAQNLREIAPTFYFAPPRIFETLLTNVTIRMEDAGWLKRWMFDAFHRRARRHGEAILEGRPVPLSGRLAYALGNSSVYGPLKNVLGLSNIRVAYTAGEAIGEDLFSFFRSLGINLKQLYGQTEAFLYVTVQKDGAVRADTVGPAAPNVDIRISDNGEVLFRSPGMFVGYFKQDDKTAEVMTRRRLCEDRRRRLLREGRAAPHHRPRQGCRQAEARARCSRRNTSRTC